jgi:hypothetical protein
MWHFASLVLLPLGAVAVANRPLSRAARLSLWAVVALAFGYLHFRAVCAEGLTCDAGTPTSYAGMYIPRFAVWGALAAAAMLWLVHLLRRRGTGVWKTAAGGYGVFVGAYLVPAIARAALHPASRR